MFRPRPGWADFRDHALVDAFRPLVEFAPIALPYRNTEPGGQLGEHLTRGSCRPSASHNCLTRFG